MTVKHPVADSAAHMRQAARTADRYFDEQTHPDVDHSEVMARARQDARLIGAARLDCIEECKALIYEGLRPKASPARRAEAGNALVCLAAMAKGLK